MIELTKLQTDKQSADKLCIPNRYQPPPVRIHAVHNVLGK